MMEGIAEETCQPYSIPIVPDELRKWNENAYVPKVVSVGPRHKGRKELLPMEKVKWDCLVYLQNRTRSTLASLSECIGY